MTTVLCTTEIISWGVLYYAFPVLAPSISEDTGWSPTTVVAAFTIAQIISAVVGLLVGRRIHTHGPRGVMTLGSAVAVIAVLAVASADSWYAFLAAWCLTGVAMAATLYPPAFAALTGWGGPRRLQALTALTLVAGLASTVFAPVAAVLDHHLGWRDTYAALAVVLTVTVPLHAWGLRAPWPFPSQEEPPEVPTTSGRARATRRRVRNINALAWKQPGFARTVTAFAVVGLCCWSVLIAFVPLLTARGFSTSSAAVALGIGGIGQVCGRLGYRRFDARTNPSQRAAIVFMAVGLTTLALALASGPYLLIVTLSFLAGMARGIFTLLQATAVTDRWGAADYARLNAAFSLPLLVMAAIAPWAATLLATALGSHALALTVLALMAASAVPLLAREKTK